MNIEERLREKSNTLIDCWLATDYDNTDMEIIKLTDAIEITKEQVEELRKEITTKIEDDREKLITIHGANSLLVKSYIRSKLIVNECFGKLVGNSKKEQQ